MQSAYEAADGCWKMIMCIIVMLAIIGLAMGAGMNSNIPDLADKLEQRQRQERQQVEREPRKPGEFPYPFGGR